MRSGSPVVAVCLAVVLSACADTPSGPPPVAHTLTYDFSSCPVNERPLWFAHQDGRDGAWVRDTPVAGRYTYTVTQRVGATALVSNAYGRTRLEISLFASAERQSGTWQMCWPRDSIIVHVGLRGLPDGHYGEVSFGGFRTLTAQSDTLDLWRITPGTYDLLAHHYNASTGADAAIVLRRDVAAWTDTTLAPVDFTVDSSFAPAKAKLTVTGAGTDGIDVQTYYHTGTGCAGLSLPPSWPADSIVGIPASRQRPGDYHELRLAATSTNGTTRFVTEWFHALADRTVALGPSLPAPVITPLTGSYRRLGARLSLPPEYRNGASFGYTSSEFVGRSVQMQATPGYIDETASASGNLLVLSLTPPEFQGLTGWQSNWVPAATSSGGWGASFWGAGTTWCAENSRTVSAAAGGSF